MRSRNNERRNRRQTFQECTLIQGLLQVRIPQNLRLPTIMLPTTLTAGNQPPTEAACVLPIRFRVTRGRRVKRPSCEGLSACNSIGLETGSVANSYIQP